MRFTLPFFTLFLITSLFPVAQETAAPKPVDFESELLPLFKANCLACHSSSKAKGGLNLETPQTILQGADSGEVLVPGNARESFLYQVTANLVEDTVMPPKDNKSNAHPFTSSELELLQRWIDEGAKGEVRGVGVIQWQKMPPGLRAIHATALSPDGSIAVCGRANQIHAYHLDTQQLEARLVDPAFNGSSLYGMQGAAHLDFVQSLAFSGDGDLLASGGYRMIKLWQRTFEAPATPSALESLFEKAHPWFCIVQSTGSVVVRNVFDVNETRVFQVPDHHLNCAATSPDQQWLVGGSVEGGLFLWRISDRALIHQEEQGSRVQALAWLPDQSGLFSGGADGLIHKWTKTDDPDFAVRLESVWQAHEGDMLTLSFLNTTTSQLVSTGADGTLKYWKPDDGNLLRTIMAGSDSIRSSTVHADIKLWAALNEAGSLIILNTEKNAKIAELKPHPKASHAIASSERSRAMAESWLKANQSDLKSLEEASTKAMERQTKAKEAMDAAAKEVSEKEKAIQIAGDKAGAEKQKLDQFEENIRQATEALELARKNAEEAKAKSLAAASQSDAVKEEGISLESLIQETAVTSFAAGQAKEAFDRITANKDEKLGQFKKSVDESEKQHKKLEGELPPLKMKHSLAKTEWDLANQAEQSNAADIERMKKTIADREQHLNAATQDMEHQQQFHQNPFQSNDWKLSFSADGSILAAFASNGDWITWSTSDGEPLESGTLEINAARMLHSDPSTNRWLIASDANLSILNTKPTWQLKRTLGNGQADSPIRDRVNALAFSPDGQWLAAGGGEPSRSGEITVWNVSEGSLMHNLDRIHSDAVLGLAYSPDGQLLATAGSDKFAKVIDCRTHDILLNLEGHTHHVMDVAWKSDGRQLATAGADQVVKIWEIPAGNRKKNLEGYEKQITSACFVGLSDQLVVSSGDTTLRLVNTEGKEIRRFESIPDFQQSTAITPDGKLIATGGDDGSLRIYPTDQDKPKTVFAAP